MIIAKYSKKSFQKFTYRRHLRPMSAVRRFMAALGDVTFAVSVSVKGSLEREASHDNIIKGCMMDALQVKSGIRNY